MQQHTHFFYALAIPENEKADLNKKCISLQKEFPFKKWTHPMDFHITLAFLGAAPEVKLNISKDLLLPGIKKFHPFPLAIQKLGTFGKNDSPRIFWAGVQNEPKLHEIRDNVYSACLKAGFQLETRPFKPHITLARTWVADSAFSSAALDESNPFGEEPLTFIAHEVVLYKTNIGKSPKYEAISTFTLAGD
ncbi:RNA 2',3'-cyclic phosphodiesterase [Bacillus sp. T33-2]|uniref:RNA 2',3'-cyclic phosphodiesterase n=1 Tax=Bacillus sp. T33-2 TaxID=2054168 RepID=UPI000C7925BD|nr:RNA 2',3'-cyclic phosphodiesterase [Bacillus sp. T33-2]PLR98192.1 RNA 2',3'-cyclic phosphodiesterase [Bacillus sp. T33-2]